MSVLPVVVSTVHRGQVGVTVAPECGDDLDGVVGIERHIEAQVIEVLGAGVVAVER